MRSRPPPAAFGAPPGRRVPSILVSTAVPRSDSRSWSRTFDDLAGGWAQRQLWGHLGWQDIKQRYRRSVLGPIWITISMAVTAIALGILYAGLFGNDLAVQLPYILVGFIVWGFISGCILEGADVFIANEGLIKHLPSPLTVHVYRLIWRQTLLFAHNMIVYAVMLVVFPQPLTWTVLAALPAFALLMANGSWVALLLGVVTTRFRDLTPITQSIVQLMFFLTPIVWIYEDLVNSPNTAIAERARLAEFNPFLHFVEIIRRPLLGEDQHLRHWIVVLVITVVGWSLTLFVMRRYRSRVSYWV
ncbi:ABC-2 type transport system permease protein [Geodermatophilus ruber]|uniref:ABC-2 type transport system permease protein n=1 Tax=Geodermatophilus ruber TaxID=504800 RepID=A0A1I4LNN2_9ACTN|nr:ABC-2 type transport system permease protein [Geodermatophilus ruber]